MKPSMSADEESVILRCMLQSNHRYDLPHVEQAVFRTDVARIAVMDRVGGDIMVVWV